MTEAKKHVIVAQPGLNMKKYAFLLSILCFLIITPEVDAAQQPNCQPIYGGAGSCEQNSPILINTEVNNPESRVYVDNLLADDPHYKAGDTILFKITLNNPEDAAVNNIEVFNYLPSYVDYVKSEGKYDKDKRTITFTLNQLKSKETKVYYVEGKVIANEKLPNAEQSRCVINQARVTAINKVSQDNSLVCLTKDTSAQTNTTAVANAATTKGGLQIYPSNKSTTTPQTGPEIWAFLSAFLFMGLGFLTRSKAKT